jgi:hypothetical protein
MQLRKSESLFFPSSKLEFIPTKLVEEATKLELLLAKYDFTAAKLKEIPAMHKVVFTKCRN